MENTLNKTIEIYFKEEGSNHATKDENIMVVKPNDEISMDNLFLSISKIGKLAHKKNIKINLDGITTSGLKGLITENLILANYSYKPVTGRLELPTTSGIAEIVNECRRIVDTPANLMNAESLIKYIVEQDVPGLSYEVLGRDELIKQGLNGIIAVNQGSNKEPKMLVIRYGDTRQEPIVLVGKGIIFDSGGINIKTGEFADMKADKTGAVYVWGLIKAMAKHGGKVNIIAVLPLAENMPGGNAIHPGDVYRTCDGRTVEITNTDAEGRIILADAFCWVNKNIPNPRLIVDIATLTGMAAAFFGGMGTAAMANRRGELYLQKLTDIGDHRHEFYWSVPLHRIFKPKLESNVADITNSSTGINAGTIMAGMFLKEFIPEKTPWIHLDIAGVSYKNMATGEPMLSLYHFLVSLI